MILTAGIKEITVDVISKSTQEIVCTDSSEVRFIDQSPNGGTQWSFGEGGAQDPGVVEGPIFGVSLPSPTDGCSGPITDTSQTSVCLEACECIRVIKQCDGNPVHLVTGRKVQREIDVGFKTPGPLDFAAARLYDSQFGFVDATGPARWFGNWRSNWEATIEEVGPDLVEDSSDFSSNLYEGDGEGGFLESTLNGDRASRNPDGSITILALSGSSRTFDASTGRLSSVSDRNGNTYTLTYAAGGGAPSTITDPVGRIVSLQTDEMGRVTSLTVPGDPTKSTWTYSYTPEGFLEAVVDPLGYQIRYAYSAEEGRLLSRTNQLQQTRSWLYDSEGRVISMVNESGQGRTYGYLSNPERRTVTSAAGETTTYFLNDDGRIVRVVTPEGGEREFDWSEDGLLLAFRDELDRATTYSYTDGLVTGSTSPTGIQESVTREGVSGQVSARVETDGAQTKATFDANGNVLTRTNSEGGVTVWTYNGRGQVLTETSPEAEVTQHVYDSQGNRIQTIAPDGSKTSFEFDALSRVTAVIDPLGRRTETEYLLHRAVSATVDALRNRRETEFDGLLRPVVQKDVDNAETKTSYTTINGRVLVASTTNALNETTTFEYDSEGRQIAVVAPNGARTETEYDDDGRPVLVRDALGGESRTVFNPDGTVQKAIGPLNETTEFFYDGERRQVKVRDALGNETETVFNERGFVVKTIAADGAETRFEHDSLGRVVKTIDALEGETLNVFDDAGRLESTVDARGNATHFKLDELGRQVKVLDTLGNVISETVYDDAGQVVQTIDAEGRKTRFEHDALGRQTKVIGPLEGETLTTYNPDGTVQSVLDANQNLTQFKHDALDRVIEVVDPLGFSVRTDFDKVGNRTKLIDESGHATEFSYDLLNRLVSTKDALDRVVTHGYDKASRRVKTVNARGDEILMQHDALGRLTKKTLPEGEETYTFDEVGRRKSAINEVLTETWSYDPLGRMSFQADSRAFSVFHVLDPNGNRIESRDSLQRLTAREFDELNRLVSLTAPDGSEMTFEYNKAGQETQRTGPGDVTSLRSYDGAGRLERLEHRVRSTGELLAAFDYTLDAVGNRIWETETRPGGSVTVRYGYDARDQLVLAEVMSGDSSLKGFRKLEYRYDPAGNRLERVRDGVAESYTYDEANQLLTRDGESFVFDADGNLLEEPATRNERRLYSYDSEGNLVATWTEKVRGGASAGGGHKNTTGKGHTKGKGKGHAGDGEAQAAKAARKFLQSYSYSPDGLKVAVERHKGFSQAAGSVEREERFWSGGRVLEDVVSKLDGSQANPRRYVFGRGGVALTLSGEDSANPREARGYLRDALGSTVGTYSVAAPADTEGYIYLPFGELVAGDEAEPISFTGQRREHLAGGGGELYAAAFRHYRPGLGQWLARDPIGFQGGDANLFAYVGNRPLIARDLSGLKLAVIGGGSSAVNSPYTEKKNTQTADDILFFLTGRTEAAGGLPSDVIKKIGDSKPFRLGAMGSLKQFVRGCKPDEPLIVIGYSAGGAELVKEAASIAAAAGKSKIDLAILLDPFSSRVSDIDLPKGLLVTLVDAARDLLGLDSRAQVVTRPGAFSGYLNLFQSNSYLRGFVLSPRSPGDSQINVTARDYRQRGTGQPLSHNNIFDSDAVIRHQVNKITSTVRSMGP